MYECCAVYLRVCTHTQCLCLQRTVGSHAHARRTTARAHAHPLHLLHHPPTRFCALLHPSTRTFFYFSSILCAYILGTALRVSAAVLCRCRVRAHLPFLHAARSALSGGTDHPIFFIPLLSHEYDIPSAAGDNGIFVVLLCRSGVRASPDSSAAARRLSPLHVSLAIFSTHSHIHILLYLLFIDLHATFRSVLTQLLCINAALRTDDVVDNVRDRTHVLTLWLLHPTLLYPLFTFPLFGIQCEPLHLRCRGPLVSVNLLLQRQ